MCVQSYKKSIILFEMYRDKTLVQIKYSIIYSIELMAKSIAILCLRRINRPLIEKVSKSIVCK